MSVLQVANIHLESTQNNRIQYLGSNTVALITGGSNNFIANSSSVTIIAGGSNTFVVNSSSVNINGSINATSILINSTPIYRTSVRQTVMGGPVTTAGIPNFFPATSASLSLTTQNISTGTNAFVAGAAQGSNSLGQNDVIFQSTSNLTWSSLTGSSTLYLYINASTGATGFTTLAPIYQLGGTPSTTNGQFTFNIAEMTGYMGNGSTAPATPLVFVGEAVTGASSVTSTVAYAYNGYYDSGFTATLPSGGTTATRSHNIGTDRVTPMLILKCTSADAGYSVGDIITTPPSGAGIQWTHFTTRNSAGFTAVSGQSATVINKSGGSSAGLTLASWSYALEVKRRW